MTLHQFISTCLYVEPEVEGATFGSVSSSWPMPGAPSAIPRWSRCAFALHFRSLLPTIRIEEIVPGSGEVIVFRFKS